jgi:hypothetical protein
MKTMIQKFARFVLAAAVAIVISGCATMPSANVQAFSTGVTAAKSQTDAAFQAVTDLTSTSIIQYAAAQPTLTDANFAPVLDPQSIAVWDGAFTALEKYAQSLVLLTSANVTTQYEDAAVGLAGEIKQAGNDLKTQHLISSAPAVQPSFAAAFTELGDVVLEAKAEHDAIKIAKKADPTIRSVLTTMADVIGTAQNQGLRGTVHANWEQRKGNLQVAFLSAKPGSDREAVATQYASCMSQQAIQDVALVQLRQSLLALAGAHHALAQGQNANVAAAAATIQQAVQNTLNLINRYQPATK